MRRSHAPSEIRQLAAPLAGVVDAAWQRVHWWIATMAVLYLLSGITIVRPDEVALILRWGRLVGDTPALQQHPAGLLFAFPRPIDQVVRVSTKRVADVNVTTLAPVFSGPEAASEEDEEDAADVPVQTLNSLVDGYAITGDHNVVQLQMVARYRVRDPGEWQFYGPSPADIIRTEATAAMVRSLGEMNVDRVLSDGRKDLIATASRRVQAGLDAAHSGLELSSLELTRLGPPVALAPDFSAVQTAFIAAETRKKDAEAFAAQAVPRARADVDASLQIARADSASDVSRATGEAAAFRALAHEYHANAAVVRERLYRDAIETAIGAAKVQWVPAPGANGYHGMRISIQSSGASGPLQAGQPRVP